VPAARKYSAAEKTVPASQVRNVKRWARRLDDGDARPTWFFDDCDVRKDYVCEQTNSCPDMAYPCYHQPDALLDWCEPMVLTDAVCESEGLAPRLPSMSLGYAYYLYNTITDPDAPTSITLTVPSPCAIGKLRSFETKFHEYTTLIFSTEPVSSLYYVGGDDGGGDVDGPGVGPLGFSSPILRQIEQGLNTNAASDSMAIQWETADTPGGHAICVNLRGEVGASAQERTMLELTHCCGTLDYLGVIWGTMNFGGPLVNYNIPPISGFTDAKNRPITEMTDTGISANSVAQLTLYDEEAYRHMPTCLTIKGMIVTFCEYIQNGLIPEAPNLLATAEGGPHPVISDMLSYALEGYELLFNVTDVTFMTFDFLVSYEACMDARGGVGLFLPSSRDRSVPRRAPGECRLAVPRPLAARRGVRPDARRGSPVPAGQHVGVPAHHRVHAAHGRGGPRGLLPSLDASPVRLVDGAAVLLLVGVRAQRAARVRLRPLQPGAEPDALRGGRHRRD